MNDYIEIEETLTDGIVTKRLINGVEYPVGEFPEDLRMQFYKGINLKQTMSVADAKKMYGDIVGIIGT